MRDIEENIKLIFGYASGLNLESFERNKLVRDAVERCLSRISEAASKLGAFAEDRLPNHDWRSIRDFGNILRHEYERVDAEVVWKILTERLPSLLTEVESFVLPFPDGEETI
ncbi:hypothetical protein CPY51_27010 [Rhizobium tubonense]|uniref:DUF86 domain-containing protein n=1 Tax=Rhizobium tubonense TaxID=484088 RepID=A0A2W4C8F1_9HYPH|nr:hypothetical protein CPY51_27010 [Rhizobium tubonense]